MHSNGGDGGDGGQQGDQQAHQTQAGAGYPDGWAGAVHDSTASDDLRECGLWNARIYSIGFIRA